MPAAAHAACRCAPAAAGGHPRTTRPRGHSSSPAWTHHSTGQWRPRRRLRSPSLLRSTQTLICAWALVQQLAAAAKPLADAAASPAAAAAAAAPAAAPAAAAPTPAAPAAAGHGAAAAAAAAATTAGHLDRLVRHVRATMAPPVDPASVLLWSNLLGIPLATAPPHGSSDANNSGGDGDGDGNSSTPDVGGGYSYLLNHRQRERGISHLGTLERLRRALGKVLSGQRLVVAVVGGSISAGVGAEHGEDWPTRLEAFLQQTYGKESPLGGDVLLHNGAVPGTTTNYMAPCVRLHVPEDADVVVVEYAVNDLHDAYPRFENPDRRAFERLMRKLLQLPNRPAVVLLNAYGYLIPDPFAGCYWSNNEAEFGVFASYYNLPTLSVKGCCYSAMLANQTGFRVDRVREKDIEGLANQVFYWDEVHPDGATGHRVMAELVMHLLQRTTHGLLQRPLSLVDGAAAAARLPPPMVPGNHASHTHQCFIGPAFKQHSVARADEGWTWVNEAKGPRPKWGYVATAPGATLVLRVNATASAGAPGAPVLVQLGHLSSYEHMGVARVKCVSGCSCDATTFNGHWDKRTSLTSLHPVLVTPSPRCQISVTVADDTDSGEHKVKLMAVMVAEEGGADQGIDNPAAVEHVHDISFRQEGHGNGSVFDIRNHVR